MKVIEIRKLKKDYQVTFENNQKILVDEDTIVSYRLIPGRVVDDVKLLARQRELNQLYQKVVRFAGYGKSENQVIKYLNEQGMENTYDFIMRLRKERIINDYQMIRNLQNQGFSYQKLLHKLNHYEFDQKDIDRALENYDERIPLRKEFSIALKKYAKEPYQKKQEKIYRYLLSKGFNEENVASIMKLS